MIDGQEKIVSACRPSDGNHVFKNACASAVKLRDLCEGEWIDIENVAKRRYYVLFLYEKALFDREVGTGGQGFPLVSIIARLSLSCGVHRRSKVK